MKLEYYLTSYTKLNPKYIKDLNVRPKTIKLLEKDIGSTFLDINNSKILYDPPPREMEIRTKINKWDLIKLKSFCTARTSLAVQWLRLCAFNAGSVGSIPSQRSKDPTCCGAAKKKGIHKQNKKTTH